MEVLSCPINDTARMLGMGRTKVYQLINQGKLDTVKIGKRNYVKMASIRKLVGEAA